MQGLLLPKRLALRTLLEHLAAAPPAPTQLLAAAADERVRFSFEVRMFRSSLELEIGQSVRRSVGRSTVVLSCLMCCL